MEKIRKPNLLLSESAYEAVRNAILTSELKPGERVSEYMVANWLNISRTPAREGLRRLEADGLLASHPRRGLVVASIDDDAIYELYAVRKLLEGAAAAMAAHRASDAEIAALQHLVDEESSLLDEPELRFDHNQKFHHRIHLATHNRYLTKYLLSMTDTLSAYRSTSTMVNQRRREAVLGEHRELCDAIARRDPVAARNAAEQHVHNGLQARIELQQELSNSVRNRSAKRARAD